MTRAVIELPVDISPVMGEMSQHIAACAYSPEAQVMAFRIREMRIIVENDKVTIYSPENEFIPAEIMDWLIDLMKGKINSDSRFLS